MSKKKGHSRYPFTRWHVVKTDVGGGSSTSLAESKTFFCDGMVHKENETALKNVDKYFPIKPGDVVSVVEYVTGD